MTWCFNNWFEESHVKSFIVLPLYVIWGIWVSRNKWILEEGEAIMDRVAHKTRFSYKENYHPRKKHLARTINTPCIDDNYA